MGYSLDIQELEKEAGRFAEEYKYGLEEFPKPNCLS
jgi:hypothetical protein